MNKNFKKDLESDQERQIISEDRVYRYGEVHTNKREVNSMLDLVKNETERLESRFLEPACGNGNFILEVLSRKINTLNKKFNNLEFEYKKNSILLASSIYGVDIIKENIDQTKNKIFDFYLNKCLFKKEIVKDNNFINSFKYILNKNILHGDALTLKDTSGSALIFSEWSILNSKIKRRDFTFKDLIAFSPFEEGTLFSDLGEEVFIPQPIKEFPLRDIFLLFEDEK